MTIPTAPPPAADTTPPSTSAPRSERFFLWVAGLGIARSDGWLGGICAGIAARLRIDPLIVRGVFVVAALFGLPAIFLYAVAWALLPDADGRIHARDLLAQDFQPTQLGILGMAIVGLIPTAPITGSLFGVWYADWTALSVFGWIVGLVLAGVLLFLIVRAARRTPGASASSPSMASTDSAAPDAPATDDGSGTVDHADAIESDAGALVDSAAPASALPYGAPSAPAALPAGPQSPEDVEAWRAQHAAWKEQDQAWRRQQQDAERAARDQGRRERQAIAATFAAEAAERRRIRRASNPRAGFAFVASVLGLAIVVGAGVWFWGGVDPDFAVAVGLFAAALALAAGMVIAGVARRRSGFLAFLTILALAGGVVAGIVPSLRGVTLGSGWVTNFESADIRQPFGELIVEVLPQENGDHQIVVDKGTGSTSISVQPGAELHLQATVGTTRVTWARIVAETGEVLETGVWTGDRRGDDTRVIDERLSAERTGVVMVQPVTIDQDSGEISITVWESREGASE